MAGERRRSPRIEILDRIHGHITSLDVSVLVREMSLGGMSLETAIALPSEAIHEFRLTLGDGSTVLLRGRVVRSREATAPDGSPRYISGVQFLDDDPPGADASVGDLINKIT